MNDLWYMDTDFCERCDALLNDFGLCDACGDDGVDDEFEESDEWDDPEDPAMYVRIGPYN